MPYLCNIKNNNNTQPQPYAHHGKSMNMTNASVRNSEFANIPTYADPISGKHRTIFLTDIDNMPGVDFILIDDNGIGAFDVDDIDSFIGTEKDIIYALGAEMHDGTENIDTFKCVGAEVIKDVWMTPDFAMYNEMLMEYSLSNEEWAESNLAWIVKERYESDIEDLDIDADADLIKKVHSRNARAYAKAQSDLHKLQKINPRLAEALDKNPDFCATLEELIKHSGRFK